MNASPSLFASSLGLYVFNAAKGHGSFVTFSLTATPQAPKEDCYLWICMCGWKIRESGRELAHSESSDAEIASAVSRFNGRRLNEVILHTFVTSDGLRYGVTLVFEENLIARLYQCEGENFSGDESILLMRDSTGTWISYLADGSIEEKPET